MSDSLKTALHKLTWNLTEGTELSANKRADGIVTALALINSRMGLDFTESLLERQLKSIPAEKSFISFVNVLGLALYKKVHYELAITCFVYRIGLNSNDKVAFNNLGLCYNRIGKSVEAARAYQGGLDADPHYKQAGSNLLYLQHYIWGANAEKIAQQHKDYAQMHYSTAKNKMTGRAVNLDTKRTLKLGFLSGDLRFHAVSRFISGVFSHLDRNKFDLFAYHTYTGPEDGITELLRANRITWNRVHDMDTETLAAQIQNDGIDILFDLSVYTQGGVPDVIAQQVAPIQINYMGYPDTSGISAMNYRIADAISDPPGTDHLYSERVVRLPVSMWNYTPWPNIPAPASPPCLANGYVTFGSMNNHAKLQKEWMEVWAKVLHATPQSKLLIKSRAMGSERIVNDVLDLFHNNGISKDRIIAKGFEARPNDHFLSFNDIDICLDTLPYNGTTTTFDSLWMGVPVVTMTGDLHVGRTSTSILTEMSMTEWVAADSREFIEICTIQANNPSNLEELRHSLRTRMRGTTLGDPAAFCKHFEKILGDIWQSYCDAPPQNIVATKNLIKEKVETSSQPVILQSGSDLPQVTIVVCAANRQHLEVSKKHLTSSVGVTWEFIGFDNSDSHYSLAEAYNKAGDLAKGSLIIFIHDDVFIATSSWGKILHKKFAQDETIGVIGVAGTAYIQSRYPYWVAAKSPFIHGQVIHHNKQLKLSRYSDAVGDQPVVAVDGLLMAVSKETFRKHRFDAKTFDGFHFYDIDFSVRASEDSKMLVTTDILTKHLSGGSFNDSWKQYRDRFRKKYDQRRIWSCVQGQPNSDSHLQRLNCHYPLNEFFDQVTVEKFEKLGKEHPKHPGFELVNSESQ